MGRRISIRRYRGGKVMEFEEAKLLLEILVVMSKTLLEIEKRLAEIGSKL